MYCSRITSCCSKLLVVWYLAKLTSCVLVIFKHKHTQPNYSSCFKLTSCLVVLILSVLISFCVKLVWYADSLLFILFVHRLLLETRDLMILAFFTYWRLIGLDLSGELVVRPCRSSGVVTPTILIWRWTFDWSSFYRQLAFMG